jgi:23S rRNA (cytosine1962-C5)-methyltransferase
MGTSWHRSAPAGAAERLLLPIVKVTERGAARLRSGHAWVYRSDLLSAGGAAAGALVRLEDPKGKPLGSALYSSSSQIAVRLLSPEPVASLAKLLRERVEQALAYRKLVVRDTDAYRLVFSEGDFLPGFIADRYNDIVTIQVLTQAMDMEEARRALIDTIASEIQSVSIVERVDPRVRELEQLPSSETRLLRGEKSATIINMNGVRFHYSALEGQKTGAFLDQRENYAAAAQFAHGRALDAFCYQGGFALHMAPRVESVTGVDSSRPALEVADRNAALNGVQTEWLEANVFDLLRDYSASGERYDTIVLDPPAFAKNRKNLETAIRGYKELNLRAFKMLRPGGILVTCSCSYHVKPAEFEEMVASAALDAHRKVRIVEHRGQAKDHPIAVGIPETGYLKCLIIACT